jgi:flagellar biosynthetic protein FliQ
MTSELVLDIMRRALWLCFQLGGPALVAALVIGVAISFIQALTQIQEATLAFLPKLVGVCLALILAMPFMLAALDTFTRELMALAVRPMG